MSAYSDFFVSRLSLLLIFKTSEGTTFSPLFEVVYKWALVFQSWIVYWQFVKFHEAIQDNDHRLINIHIATLLIVNCFEMSPHQ
jgi:hypothetical protein